MPTLWGVNLAGGEFGGGDVLGTDYTYPNNAELDYYSAKGMKIVRVPFLARRLIRSGAISALDADILSDLIDYAALRNLSVVLDMHDYGRTATGGLIGVDVGSVPQFAASWGLIADRFKAHPNAVFGLNNEPNAQSASEWLQGANAAIDAIRDTGAAQLITVAGSYWDGAWTWVSSDNDTVVGTGVVDPGNNYIFEVHQYLDVDGSGTHNTVVSATVGPERLAAATSWARANGKRFMLGELGVANNPESLAALDNTLRFLSENQDVWHSFLYWAGGPWWGEYMFTIEPLGSVDRAQMDVMERYISQVPPVSVSPNGTTATPGVDAIISTDLARWTVTTGRVVQRNSVNAGYSANVKLILWWNGLIYQTNVAGGWWSWTGVGWKAVAGDPRPPVSDTIPPSVPANLRKTRVDLIWSPSTDNIGVVSYRVFRNGVQIGATAGTFFSDASPVTGGVYTVRAVDAAGNVSAPSQGAI